MPPSNVLSSNPCRSTDAVIALSQVMVQIMRPYGALVYTTSFLSNFHCCFSPPCQFLFFVLLDGIFLSRRYFRRCDRMHVCPK